MVTQLALGAPASDDQAPAPFHLDTNKVYPPDPPSSLNVFMGFRYTDKYTGEEKVVDFVVKIFDNLTPKAAENFKMMSQGFKVITNPNEPDKIMDISFVKTPVYNVVPGVKLEAGQIFENFGFCLYGEAFEDESFEVKHDRPGRLSLVTKGPNTNESRFIIDLSADGTPERDGKNVAFGQVISGLEDLINAMNRVEIDKGTKRPMQPMIISYTVVDELKISNIDELAAQHKLDVKAFEAGDKSKGFHFKTKSNTIKNHQDLVDVNYTEFNHPVMKVVILFAILAIFYVAMKNKDQIMAHLPLKARQTSIRNE